MPFPFFTKMSTRHVKGPREFLAAFLATISILSLTARATEPEKARLTTEQAITVRKLKELRWSPDGTRLAFTVTEPPKGTDTRSHIWIFGNSDVEPVQFTTSAKSESHPRWSPDSKRLAFLSDRQEFQQIYVMPANGGEALPLTEGKRSIKDFEWSPDGKQIAFLAPEAKTDAEEKKEKDKDDAKSVDRNDKRDHLWMIDVESRKTKQLLGSPWNFSELQWLPDKEQLAVTATDHPESDQETNRIFLVDTADGKMQSLAAPRGPFEGLRVSSDKTQISYVGARVDGPAPHDLFAQSLSGGAPRNLSSAPLDRPVEAYEWQTDGKLLALTGDGFRSKFYVIDGPAHAEPLHAPPVYISSFALSSSGLLAFVGENMHRPPELFIWDLKSSQPRSVSHFNQALAQLPLAQPEFLRYRTFDGRQIEAALLRPPGAEAGTKLPTIFLIHGGPTGNWSDEYEPWPQLLANAGYAVLCPNIRGSTGYGYDFMVLNRGDWGGADFKDVMAGVDYLIAQGIADPQRLGVAGWSYGGYMAEWAITQTSRFKAAVSGAGMSDLAAEFSTEVHPAYDEWFYGLPYEKPDGFRHSSPLTYIKNAHTPTLILQGDADVIDPLGQSQALYRALKRYGVETELVVYPREGHGLKEEKHLVDRLNRIVGWFDKHLK